MKGGVQSWSGIQCSAFSPSMLSKSFFDSMSNICPTTKSAFDYFVAWRFLYIFGWVRACYKNICLLRTLYTACLWKPLSLNLTLALCWTKPKHDTFMVMLAQTHGWYHRFIKWWEQAKYCWLGYYSYVLWRCYPHFFCLSCWNTQVCQLYEVTNVP